MWRSCAARATLLLSTAHAALGAAAPKKPNIMLLLTDDQDLALGGWTPMKQADGTWVADGATAVNWFIHTPVCCPSRGELLSGRYFHNIRNPTPSGGCMHVNTSVVNPNSFGAHLAGAGYTMAWFGKHMNQCPKEPPPGWDCPTCYWFANGGGADAEPGGFFNATFNDYAGGKAVANPALYGGKTGAYTANTAGGEFAGYTTSVIANKSIAWLKQVAAGPEPFFLALAPKAPHVAATPAPWYLEGTFIDDLRAPRGPAYNASKELLADHHWLIAQQDPITEAQGEAIDHLFRDRWRALLSVDDAVAAVIATLKDLGVYEHTYMFYSSDHGYNLGEHRLPSCKLNVYDHDIRIPLVARGPGIKAGSTFEWIGSNVDLAPTFLALAGAALEHGFPAMDGRSVAAKLITELDDANIPVATRAAVAGELSLAGVWRDHHWVEYYSLGNVTRTGHLVDDSTSNTYRALRFVGSAKYGNYLYAEFTAVADWHFEADLFIEMYDVDKDPHQLHNLAKTAPAALKADLHEMVLKQFACAGATCT